MPGPGYQDWSDLEIRYDQRKKLELELYERLREVDLPFDQFITLTFKDDKPVYTLWDSHVLCLRFSTIDELLAAL